MKTKEIFIITSWLLCLTLLCQPASGQAVRHPGPLITCPICMSYTLRKVVDPAMFVRLPTADKTRLIRKVSGTMTASEVSRTLALTDAWKLTDITKTPIGRDPSFQAYFIEFGDGAQKKFYTVKSSTTDWTYASNSADDIFRNVLYGNKDKESVYLLADNIYSKEYANFADNLELFNTKKKKAVLKSIGCDVSIDDASRVRSLGTTFLEPNARLRNISDVTAQFNDEKMLTEYVGSADFMVGAKRVRVGVVGKTMDAVKNFLNRLKNIFIVSPNSSIAKAVNRSKRYQSNVDVYFNEAGLTQYVLEQRHQADQMIAITSFSAPFCRRKLHIVPTRNDLKV